MFYVFPLNACQLGYVVRACMDDQKPNFKHYCRVCKKGFMCGRALGGHMRAHGIEDEKLKVSGDKNDGDCIRDWEEKYGGGSEMRVCNKRMYQLRTNPNRLKSCRSCENCGKEFLSWKSFLEHGKCTSNDASESLVSSHESGGKKCNNSWSKRKRTLHPEVGCGNSSICLPSKEDDLFLAKCLMQLANTPVMMAEVDESCASMIQEERKVNQRMYLNTMPRKGVKGMFECKACKKVFNSHQALGGHRASHKKVKGCFASKQDQMDENNPLGGIEDNDLTTKQELLPSNPTTSYQLEHRASGRKSKVHECSICHRVFTSGQALGGHKRCHWISSNAPLPSLKFHLQPIEKHSEKSDLNVPAWTPISEIEQDPQTPAQTNLQPWIGHNARNNNNHLQPQFRLKHIQENNFDDELDSKLELPKLSNLNELHDMGNSGNSSQWLQVGIGSTTTESITTTITTVLDE